MRRRRGSRAPLIPSRAADPAPGRLSFAALDALGYVLGIVAIFCAWTAALSWVSPSDGWLAAGFAVGLLVSLAGSILLWGQPGRAVHRALVARWGSRSEVALFNHCVRLANELGSAAAVSALPTFYPELTSEEARGWVYRSVQAAQPAAELSRKARRRFVLFEPAVAAVRADYPELYDSTVRHLLSSTRRLGEPPRRDPAG